MKKRTLRLFALTLALGLGLLAMVLIVPEGGLAQPWERNRDAGQSLVVARDGASSASVVDLASLTSAAPSAGMAPMSIVGSSVATEDCYQADKPQTLCFTVFNGSTDGEWIDYVLLRFPTIDGNWQAACNTTFQDSTDSVGYTVNFNCTTPAVNQVVYQDGDSDGWGEISQGASWRTCVDVTVPAGYVGNRFIPWELQGDGPGTASGSIMIEQCTPLTLKPSQVVIEGCNGAPQMLDFELHNYGAGDTDVELVYESPGAYFGGGTFLHLNEGEIITFTTEFEPKLCLEPGEQIHALLTAVALGSGQFDTSAITHTITANAGWHRRDDSPIPAMDNAVVWASHADGGLWSIGGYGSGGAAQRYDPSTGEWLTYTNPLTPLIEYPMDGCYGLNDQGQEIVVLFPDTIVTDTLHVFNITTHQWSTRPIPGFFPTLPKYIGHWGFDVVSLLNNPAVKPGITDKNMCYLSGGNNERPGGGTTRNLWRYDPETNGGEFVGNFADPVTVFGFHASWYVPWIGDNGAICVAGGIDHKSQVNNTTQCYDIAADNFNGLNADLGTLPEPWWGMADGWQVEDGHYQIWIANGVAQNGTLLPASAYFQEGMTGFAYGPEIPHGLYRLEGDSWNGRFYTLNGARGWFSYSEFSLQLASCPTCHRVFLPLTLRAYE